MEVKIKKLNINAVIPKYSLSGDAGLDLTAASKHYDEFGNVHYGTGLAFSIPEGYVGLLFPRSSNAKKDLILSNSVGVLDSNYRGEVSFKFKPSLYFADNKEGGGTVSDNYDYVAYSAESEMDTYRVDEYKVGDRIGQIIILPYPKIKFKETDDLGETVRGEGGYGSTGK